jgi:superfamily I DNA and RNA helicase
VQHIKHNLTHDGLVASREILVVVLGSNYEAIKLETYVASFLMEQGINIFVPSATRLNQLNPKFPDTNPDLFWYPGGVTVSRVPRAKGNEADMVYVVGFDNVAKYESDTNLRNQLFVALTRARGWVRLSGVGIYPMYNEMKRVIDSGDTFTFTYNKEPGRDMGSEETPPIAPAA